MNHEQRLFAIEALAEAYKAKAITGLPASILASQCILETGWGKRIPTDINTGKFSYNLFGIKGEGSNGSVLIWTHEYYVSDLGKKKVRIKTLFRAYHNYSESFVDYGNLILGAKRYKQAVIRKDKPREYIYELWKAGYATDPDYVKKVLKIAESCGFIPEGYKDGRNK